MLRTIALAVLLVLAISFGYLTGRHQAEGASMPDPSRAAVSSKAAAPANPIAASGQGAAQERTPSDPDLLTTDSQFNPDFVKAVLPQREVVADEIPVTGKLSLDAQQVRLSSARVAGRLGRIFVFEGQTVHEGEPLAELYSADYISAENEFLLSRKFRSAMQKNDAGVDSELKSDAQATYDSASNRLKVLGATDADIAALVRKGSADEYLKIRAPISGVITKRNVDPGGFLNVGDTLMTLANVDRLWLFANTYESDYAALKLGETLEFHTAALPGASFRGEITFIAPSVDPATHTLAIRCDVPNTEGLLRPEMFVSGALKIGQREGIVIPKQAVLLIKDADYVFLKEDDQHYRRVAVKGHAYEHDEYVITDGLTLPKPVVIDGAVLLNQLLGAG